MAEKNNKPYSERKIITFLTKLFDLFLLNVLWTLCCIPVITIGASTTALYDMTMKMVTDEEPPVLKGFFKSFRSNFKSSVPLTLIMGGCLAAGAADLYFFSHMKFGGASVLSGICISLLLLLLVINTYLWALHATFSNTTLHMFINAFKIAMTHLPQTILLLVTNYFIFLCAGAFPDAFLYIAAPYFLIGNAVIAYINSPVLKKIFHKFMPKDQETGKNPA